MLKQYLVTAFRNINRNKSYSIISILGLSLGIAVFFLIVSFIRFETGFEESEKDLNRIFNVYWSTNNQESIYASTPLIFAQVFRYNYSNIAECAQISEEWDYGRLKLLHKGNEIKPENVFYVEPQIFDVLSFKLNSGSLNNFKNNINAVLLSESASQKIFGGENVIGKTIQIKYVEKIEEFIVSGIMKDRPENSQLRPDFYFNMSYFKSKIYPDFVDSWRYNNPITYFKLKNNITSDNLQSAIENMQKKFMPDERKTQHFKIIPLKDVHLHSSQVYGFFGVRGSVQKVYLFAFIAFLILLTACINFVNLNTARASQRIKEISVRKILGAKRKNLFLQIMLESVLFSLLALPAAIFIAELIGNFFYDLLNREMIRFSFLNPGTILFIITIPVIMGVLAGLYTAYYSLKNITSEYIYDSTKVLSTKTSLRRVLIGFQYIVFFGLIICSLIIYKQMHIMIDGDLGYNKNNLIIIDAPDNKYTGSIDAFLGELKNQNSIINATYTSSLPPSIGNIMSNEIAAQKDDKEKLHVQFITCDRNYIPTVGIQLIQGTNFINQNNNDNGVIISELMARKLGLKDNAIGVNVFMSGSPIRIIGVFKDFHSQSFYTSQMPVMLQNSSGFSCKIAVKYKTENLRQAMDAVHKTWKSFFDQSVLNISFSDKELEKVYDSDLRFSKLILMFTIVSIFISVIGLAALSAITAAKRKKEIGVRKVLGASVVKIVILLSKEVLLISVIGSLIAYPLSFYFISKWLDNFTYKVELNIFYMLLVFFAGLTISLAAISFQAIKAAMANPIESLRHE